MKICVLYQLLFLLICLNSTFSQENNFYVKNKLNPEFRVKSQICKSDTGRFIYQYFFDIRGNITQFKEVHSNGDTLATFYKYDTENNIIARTGLLNLAKKCNVESPENARIWQKEYNILNSNCQQLSKLCYRSNSDELSYAEYFVYNDKNKIIEYFIYDPKRQEKKSVTTFTYYRNYFVEDNYYGKHILEKTKRFVNKKGQIILLEFQNFDCISWSKRKFEYNKKGQKIKEIQYNWHTNQIIDITEFIYNEKGLLIEEKNPDGYSLKYEYTFY
jgi:hypothetical protein